MNVLLIRKSNLVPRLFSSPQEEPGNEDAESEGTFLNLKNT